MKFEASSKHVCGGCGANVVGIPVGRCCSVMCGAVRWGWGAVLCSVVRCGAVLCCAVRCCTVRCGSVRCGAVLCSAVRCGAARCVAVRCGAAQERDRKRRRKRGRAERTAAQMHERGGALVRERGRKRMRRMWRADRTRPLVRHRGDAPATACAWNCELIEYMHCTRMFGWWALVRERGHKRRRRRARIL